MKTARILIVEDDYLLQTLYRRVLSHSGFEVTVAKDAHEALEYLRHTQPDLMTLDVNLPDMNGLDLLHFVRTHLNLTTMRVIIVTANVMATYDVDRHLADLFLEKPLYNRELIQACLRLLDKADCSAC